MKWTKEKPPKHVVIKVEVYLEDDTFQPTYYIIHLSLLKIYVLIGYKGEGNGFLAFKSPILDFTGVLIETAALLIG